MGLPVSKSALDRLGVRLASSDSISESDLQELAIVASAYQSALDRAKLHLGQLGYSATTRVKTTGTLIEKLQRESARLSQVQDLAGARIVVVNRAKQNDAVNEIREVFERLEGGGCKVIDRRENPSYGYRAVHLVVRLESVPIEIQVRTDLQDIWAQITEKLADRWGRGIRYGEDPENPDAEVQASGLTVRTRRQAIESLGTLSNAVAKAEEFQLHAIQARRQIDSTIQIIKDIERSDSSRRLLDEELPPEISQPVIDAVRKLLDSSPKKRSMDFPQSMTLNDIFKVSSSVFDASESLISGQARYNLQLIAQLTDG
jgi:ppGpp synthetase/RelA/SpoT-type nucleotidyltranferase